jgi:hypothetical protein
MASENRACNRNAMAKATLAIVELNDGAEILSTDGLWFVVAAMSPAVVYSVRQNFVHSSDHFPRRGTSLREVRKTAVTKV